MKNIVLIGLSGCGKSTVGALAAKKLQMPFVDMDAYIEQQEGRTVSEIFAQNGEAYFRRLETEAAQKLSETENKVIATGGGAVLSPQNMSYLKETGIVLFLDRTPEEILRKINLKVRPLLAQDKNRLFELERSRRPLYEKYADITLRAVGNVPQTVSTLLDAVRTFKSR